MLFDTEQVLLIAGYIRDTYKDADAYTRFQGFLNGFDSGWQNAIQHATQYVNDWHSNMDSYGDSTVKGILNEVEGGIRQLEFGDV